MYAIQKFLNYLTIIFALLTIGDCIYVAITRTSPFLCTILLISTIILNSVSRMYNNKNIKLTEEDKELLKGKKGNFDKNKK